jgi:multiple sugar transport system ATP-binding protein
MRTEIARLQRRLGITTVYVTHDQTEAMTLGDRVCVLRKGLIQQVASPRELYEQPVNLFVAGFIGSPPMNFLPATLEGTRLSTPFGPIDLEEDRAAKVAGHDLLLVGIRPEYFEDASLVDPAKRSLGSLFRARVDVTEWLGDSQYAYIPYQAPPAVETQLRELSRELDSEELRTQAVVSIDSASRIRVGREAEFWLDSRKVHVFDPATGENLTRDAEAGAELTRLATQDRVEQVEEARAEVAGSTSVGAA